MKHLLPTFCFLIGLIAFSQEGDQQISWEEVNFPSASLTFNNETKSFNYSFVIGENVPNDATITNITFKDAPEWVAKLLQGANVPLQIQTKYSVGKARNKALAEISFDPVVQQNGNIKVVSSFSIQRNNTAKPANNTSIVVQNFPITNSVFSSGNWYKFYVEKTGVHRISKSFLESLGMNTDNINPSQLKIVSHGGKMLPLNNSEIQFFDPPEISIKVVDGGDGSFDDGDYILFYGEQVDGEWSEENETNLNLYADRAYYYISADGGIGKRVSALQQPSGPATSTINTFHDYSYYEVDETNIANLGRRWFGDRFDFENQRTYSFKFPNLITSEEIEMEGYVAAVSESTTSFSFSANQTNLGARSISGLLGDNQASGDTANFDFNSVSDNVDLVVTFNNNGNPSSLGYLDYINLSAVCQLAGRGVQFNFKNNDVAAQSGIGQYNLTDAQDISEVWDVTETTQISSIENTQSSSNFSFKAQLGEVREYIAVVNSDFYTPIKISSSPISNQNIKGNIFNDGPVDYLMITNQTLLQQATRLANFRSQRDGLNIKVLLLDDIYKEFSSGKQDIVAIRNLVRYVYLNSPNPSQQLKYLCLFGDSSIDYKNRIPENNMIVPTYQRLSGFNVGSSSAASDDFFGFMDATEGDIETNTNFLDIAVGRILADTPSLAKTMVDKIIAYESKESYGSWRNNFVLISDDADNTGSGGYGLQVKLDEIGDDISAQKPFINVKKIHSDAYQQESAAGGFRYPEVNEDISEAIEVGAVVVNYFGHGGENGLASERIVTVDDILSWQNQNKFNLFVTVTCEFTRFDNPERISPGEYNLFNDDGGSAAMVTTTRTIPVTTGTLFNEQIAPFLFNYAGGDDSIAEAVRKAKNNIGSKAKRVVFYFGDPAMKLSLADPEVNLTSINDQPFNQAADTLKALGRVKLAGEIVDANGNLLNNYNGELSTIIFDKRIDRNTLNNDGSGVFDFTTLGEIIFRGKSSVTNGLFEFEFVVPKDIAIPVGDGRISFYSEENDELEDHRGYTNEVKIGGVNEDAPADNEGPEIQLFMNTEDFVSGEITDSNPFLIAKLKDENGINTASGIGHDLTAILDGNETDPYIVNDYYETELDDFTQGTVNYRLRDLEEGLHTLTFKAWDVYNNSSTAEIQFRVTSDNELKITRVLNYPNPFHDYTEFWFNHNRPFEPLEVQVQVFTVTGKIVWTGNQTITTDGFLSREITWNGKDDFGDAIGKGVYVYKLTVKSTLSNKKVEKYEKLVIL